MVVDIPPDGRIYRIGRINGSLHIYDTNHPGAAQTQYVITISNVVGGQHVMIQPGHTDTYAPNNNMVFIQNNGPSKLQALYLEASLTPEFAGWTVEEAHPSV